ncbi:hypothetical protein B0H10DRAFT_2081063 [Mycena sp. CBHHK59/15]|nr:hypothetical protein B0H10DRAFT_2081063 [Mycena sp. CBHHK59/15]
MMMPSAPHLRPYQNGRPLTSGMLPKYYPPEDKYHKKPIHIWVRVPVSLCGLKFHIVFPSVTSAHRAAVTRFGRLRGALVLFLVFLGLGFILFALVRRFGSPQKTWPGGDPPTLVFKREDLGRIWRWEIASGHYPSRLSIPQKLGLKSIPDNPALPPRKAAASRFKTTTNGVGPSRVYLDIQSHPPNVAYPPRPFPGSVADLDIITEHCDFGEGKYVRDWYDDPFLSSVVALTQSLSLEVLRVGGGLDNGNRVRRGKMDDWNPPPVEAVPGRKGIIRSEHEAYLDEGFTKSRHAAWEPPIYRLHSSLNTLCDPDDPRLFHMYWTGPFTDKPHLAILSFLFTQNTGLHLADQEAATACAPMLWIWINPGPASVVSGSATQDLFEQLKTNPWASPFLHPRFKHLIHFKLWNTPEQLDSIPEIKDDWRKTDTLFKSGGHVIALGVDDKRPGAENDLANRTGSSSPDLYDKLSVIMSDMARFILCHRHGGIYVDADTLFLRDWEEMWGWKGAFSYRWSFHDKYNTAVLRLRKGSALGHFILRSAVKNGFDFHPFEITKYLKEASLDHLMTRIPDAVFDGAWLNMEGYQRERPPQPFSRRAFAEFFVTPLVDSGAPQALGFDGFFKGAYSYHFHNSWWLADRRDLDWSTVLKRTFEGYIRGENPNMYGEYLVW